jgi:hypothetical protein
MAGNTGYYARVASPAEYKVSPAAASTFGLPGTTALVSAIGAAGAGSAAIARPEILVRAQIVRAAKLARKLVNLEI